jgi:transposase
MKYDYIGIDIAKSKLDICLMKKGKLHHEVIPNSSVGFSKLLNQMPENPFVVMEATGTYHLPLCTFLAQQQIDFRAVNPRNIKRFGDVDKRLKTDKVDARIIRSYGEAKQPEAQKAPQEDEIARKQWATAVDQLQKQVIQSQNGLEAARASGMLNKELESFYEGTITHLNSQLAQAQKRLEDLVQTRFSAQQELLKTIPGIGVKTAIQLLIHTDAFENFEEVKSVVAYVGLDPSSFESGSSIHRKNRISKQGNSRLRKALFMASLSAKRYNPACKALFDRLISKGKQKRQALIAVAHKLLRQAFAVVKNNTEFSADFA